MSNIDAAIKTLAAAGYKAIESNMLSSHVLVEDPVVTLGVNGKPNTVSFSSVHLHASRVHAFIAERS